MTSSMRQVSVETSMVLTHRIRFNLQDLPKYKGKFWRHNYEGKILEKYDFLKMWLDLAYVERKA